MWKLRLMKLKKLICVCVQKERSSLLKELKALREERTQLLAELEKYKECDPEVVKEMSEYRSLFLGGEKNSFKL